MREPETRPSGFAVDLDDTLYPQRSYLVGAVAAVADRARCLGLARGRFVRAYESVLAAGSDGGGTIERALESLGLEPDRIASLAPALVEAFVSYRPSRLRCFGGAREALAALRRIAPVALLSDGRPDIQHAKLAALGLADAFDAVVITDELGRQRRKPDPAGLLLVAETLDVAPASLLVIGDRVDKDVEVALRVGSRAIRVRTGEYRRVPTPPGIPDVASFAEAVRLVRRPAG